MTKLWYLASPYAKYPDGVQAAHEAVCKEAGLLAKNGIYTFCPMAHMHPIDMLTGFQFDTMDETYDFWLGWDKLFLDKCYGIIVSKLPSWETSRGVNWEIEYMKKQMKPHIYMEPGIIPQELLNQERVYVRVS